MQRARPECAAERRKKLLTRWLGVTRHSICHPFPPHYHNLRPSPALRPRTHTMPSLPFLFKPAPAAPGLALTRDHGLVLLVAAANVLVCNFWMAFRVGAARKQHGVSYPNMVGPDAFNCVMRGHLNSLEQQPAALALLILASAVCPRFAAAAGAVWVVGRVFYFLGYSTGEPAKRMWGAWSHFGTLAEIFIIVKVGLKLVTRG